MKFAIWQIFFNEQSKNNFDLGFIPYNNYKGDSSLLENNVLLDLYLNEREKILKVDYVGFLSHRLKEKTGLTSDKIYNIIKSDRDPKDVYSLSPSIYSHYKNPFHETGFSQVQKLSKLIDSKNMFPEKLFGFHSDKYHTFCNYFVCRPDFFVLYMEKYFLPVYNFLYECNDIKLKKILMSFTEYKGAPYPVLPFWFEGLFDFACHIEQPSFVHIQNGKPYNETAVKNKILIS